MIALEFLPPLGFLAYTMLRRPAAALAAAVVVLIAWHAPADAQSFQSAVAGRGAVTATATPAAATPAAPTPAPGSPAPGSPTPVPAPPVPPGTPVPAPTPLPAPTPAPGTTGTPIPGPQQSVPVAVPPIAAPTPAEPPPGSPAPSLSAPATPPSAPAATPSLQALPSPTPNPFGYIITPTPVPASVPDGPHILEVDLNDRRIHAGGPLLVRVLTSANVVGVEARALGRFIPIPQSSPGLFALAYTMPGGIPFWWLNRSYDIVIAAATADGRQTSVAFPMLLTR